jgi:hypothetical protein
MYTPWQRPATQTVMVCRAVGCFVAWWPSGERTLGQYYVAGIVPLRRRVNCANALSVELEQQEENMTLTARVYREIAHRPGWLVVRRRNGRPRARRVRAVAWLHPEAYEGPAPRRGNRI